MPSCYDHQQWFQEGSECPVCSLVAENNELRARISVLESTISFLRTTLCDSHTKLLTHRPRNPRAEPAKESYDAAVSTLQGSLATNE